ncbi:FAD-binding oxidoreductase [Echinicola sp. 20G]|uniref:FAD-binding oxidoreductase n=1 Tax=Echinicola sp. 20G TaxID=2781961 RepID=UPI0019109F96|nr:FAD-binding oxidoreductase [Echinicola sp. 20G]
MPKIFLKNNRSFECGEHETIFEGAKSAGIVLEHSCLNGRCSSCKVQVMKGSSEPLMEELPLKDEDKNNNFILSCIRKPISDMEINAEDLGKYNIPAVKTLPTKIQSIEKLNDTVIKVVLRFPPNQAIEYLPGQYVDIIRGGVKRSYSIANAPKGDRTLTFFIKNYEGGEMSRYWFDEAKVNDLLRVQGPKGTFFLRELDNSKNIVFLATGTGIAPVMAILESIKNQKEGLSIPEVFVFWGGRFKADHFCSLEELNLSINYIPVLSREKLPGIETGYIQQVLLRKNIDLKNSVFYACGSDNMIHESKDLLMAKGINEHNFYSDAFVISN